MLENIKKLQVKSVFLLFLSEFGFCLCIFSRNHLVPMVDGPYYLIQIKSILTTGSLVYGAPPLTFYLLSIFSFLSGDVTLGLKVGVSFFCALSTIPAYFLTALLFLAIYTVLVLIFDVDRRSFMKSVGIITSIILAFIFVATTFFSSLFEDFNLAFYFIRDLMTPRINEIEGVKTIPNSFGPIQAGQHPLSRGVNVIGGWGMILSIISIGIILSFYTWKKRQKEASFLLIAATTISSIICFPLIPGEWLFRTSLMIVMPAAIILSYGISRIWKSDYRKSKVIAVIVFAICLFFFVGQNLRIARGINPTISDEGYRDLIDMKDRIPANSIVFTEHSVHYWVEYVDEVEVARASIEELSPELGESYSHVLFYSL